MKGFLISYIPKSSYSRTIFNHLLFGRILYRKRRGKEYAYYIPGMLDNISYIRIMNSRIFTESIDNIDIAYLNDYAEVEIKECEREIHPAALKTGEIFWKDRVSEKGLPMRRKRRTRRQ